MDVAAGRRLPKLEGERRVASEQIVQYECAVSSSFQSGAAHPQTSEDDALLDRITARDRDALAELYDRWSATVFAVALRVLGSRSDAEDIVQDTFVDVWRRAKQFEPTRGSARSWLLTIARNRSIDRLRAGRVATKAIDDGRVESNRERPRGADEQVEQQRHCHKVQAALTSLSPEQRTVLELGYFEGLTQVEIAARLGEPLGTVKSRVRAALEKLGKALSSGDMGDRK